MCTYWNVYPRGIQGIAYYKPVVYATSQQNDVPVVPVHIPV